MTIVSTVSRYFCQKIATRKVLTLPPVVLKLKRSWLSFQQRMYMFKRLTAYQRMLFQKQYSKRIFKTKIHVLIIYMNDKR